MTWKLIPIVIFSTHLLSSAQGATIPTAVDAETCIDLCSSCDGIAKYEDGHCECSIAANLDNETECVGRMKRHAHEYGLDVVSCDMNEDEVPRTTRCTLGHKHSYGKNDMERVAKYFMQDGPMTGSIFIAPPFTKVQETLVGKSADCDGSSKGIITQPAETMISEPKVGASQLITQPQEFMPVNPIATLPAARVPAATLGSPLTTFGFQELAPQFLSMLGEVLTRPILGLPHAIQSVSKVPGVSDLVGVPANFLNSLADQMAEKSKIAKQNLNNFREVVGKAKQDVKDGLANLKESKKATVESSMQSSPSYSIMNPQPMLSWLNPTVGAPAPTQFVGAPAPMQLVAPTQFLSTAQLVATAVPSQIVSASPVQSQIVGASSPGESSSSDCGSQMVGSPSPSFTNQMVGAQIFSTMPVIQSLGTIPLSSIVGQMSPTYFVGSPMTYYTPTIQTTNTIEETADDVHQSLEEVPLSSSPQKKICKKATRDQPSTKYSRDVKSVEKNKEQLEEVKIEQTTTTTTEVPMIERTTTQKPKVKADKSVIGKIKPLSKKIKAEKKNVDSKL